MPVFALRAFDVLLEEQLLQIALGRMAQLHQQQPDPREGQGDQRPPEEVRPAQIGLLPGGQLGGDIRAQRHEESDRPLGQDRQPHARIRGEGAWKRRRTVLRKQRQHRQHLEAAQQHVDLTPSALLPEQKGRRAHRRRRQIVLAPAPQAHQHHHRPQRGHPAQQAGEARREGVDLAAGEDRCRAVDHPEHQRRLVRVVYAVPVRHQPVAVRAHLPGDVGEAGLVRRPEVAAQIFAAPVGHRRDKNQEEGTGGRRPEVAEFRHGRVQIGLGSAGVSSRICVFFNTYAVR